MPYATVLLNDEVVPGAAAFAPAFLDAVRLRAIAEQVPLTFAVIETGPRRDRHPALRAEFTVGSWLTRSSRYRLDVFAQPTGSSLHVGLHLLEPQAGAFASAILSSRRPGAVAHINGLPHNHRELNGIVQSLERAVFVPVVQQLVDGV